MTGRFSGGKMSTFIRSKASTPAKVVPAMSTITVTGRRKAAEIGFIGADGCGEGGRGWLMVTGRGTGWKLIGPGMLRPLRNWGARRRHRGGRGLGRCGRRHGLKEEGLGRVAQCPVQG